MSQKDEIGLFSRKKSRMNLFNPDLVGDDTGRFGAIPREHGDPANAEPPEAMDEFTCPFSQAIRKGEGGHAEVGCHVAQRRRISAPRRSGIENPER